MTGMTFRHIARKRFGQHFLVDRHYIDRIVAAIDPRPGDNLVEIGPGLGALTRPLLERLGRLTVIEIDRDLAARIAAEFEPDRLVLHNADALDFDFAKKEVRGRYRPKPMPIGNMNVTAEQLILQGTDLLFAWTAVILLDNGRMTATIADRKGAFVLFGQCKAR